MRKINRGLQMPAIDFSRLRGQPDVGIGLIVLNTDYLSAPVILNDANI